MEGGVEDEGNWTQGKVVERGSWGTSELGANFIQVTAHQGGILGP